MAMKKFMPLAKIFVISVLFVMIGLLINSTILNPIQVLGAAGGGDWGDEFKNSNGKTICICDDKETDCKPCLTIQEPIE